MPATTTISSSTATNPATTALTTSSDPQQQQQGEAATTTATATTSTQRTKNTTCYLPVVYGSIAYYLGKKKSDEYNTHEWTLFVRGPNQEDLSPVISKVVFQLHPSFAQPTRELTEPPYEVTERGWGEFEAQIRIHWKDTAQEQSTVVNHTIRLYPPGTPPNMTQSNKTSQALEKPVLAEIYDEVVFTNPTEDFYQSLQQIDQLPKIELASANATTEEASSSANSNSQLKKEHVEYYNDEDDFLALVAAQKFLKDELSKVKRRFENVTGETTSADRSITTAAKAAAIQQSQQRARDAAAQAQQQAAAAAAGLGGGGGKSSGGGSGGGGTSSKKRPSSTSKSGGGKKASSKRAKTASSSSSNAGAAGASNAATASNTKSGK